MADITKTEDRVMIAHQAVTHPATVMGTITDFADELAVTIVMYHGFVEAAANTNPGIFYVMISPSSTGNEDWATVAQFTATTGTPDDETISGAEAQGSQVIEVAATAGFAAGDYLYIQDTGVVADGEWNMCQEIVTNTSINLMWGLTNAKDGSDIIFNDAEMFVCQLDLTAVARVQVNFMHEGAAGANVHIKSIAISGDDIV